jgi:hypothetical protein
MKAPAKKAAAAAGVKKAMAAPPPPAGPGGPSASSQPATPMSTGMAPGGGLGGPGSPIGGFRKGGKVGKVMRRGKK